MPKVITGAGLQEFIESGKHEVLPNKPEIKPSEKAAPPPEEKAETPAPLPPPVPAPEDDGLEPDDIDLTEHVRKKINKKHRQMKEAQEAAADAEAFAKNQYERARLAEERAAALEKERDELKKVQAPKEPELKKPDIKEFTDDKGQVRWTDFTEASADYAAKKAVADERARQAQEREQQEKTRIESQFKARVDAAVKKYPDFHDAISKSEAWLPNAVLQYITESEYGPDVSYYLATHSEAVDKISKLPPIKAIAEIGKLELTFEKPEKPAVAAPEPKAQERGGAPPPITPISGTGTGTVNTDPSKMSFRELRDYERNKRQKR